MVRQIFVTLEKLVINDREINVNAHLVKSDGTPDSKVNILT